MKIVSGGVKFTLFIEEHILTEAEVDAMFELDDIEEVSSEGEQSDKIVFYLPDAEALTKERVDTARADIQAILDQELGYEIPCEEHDWRWSPWGKLRWICNICFEEAESKDPDSTPCASCGAHVEEDESFCKECM